MMKNIPINIKPNPEHSKTNALKKKSSKNEPNNNFEDVLSKKDIINKKANAKSKKTVKSDKLSINDNKNNNHNDNKKLLKNEKISNLDVSELLSPVLLVTQDEVNEIKLPDEISAQSLTLNLNSKNSILDKKTSNEKIEVISKNVITDKLLSSTDKVSGVLKSQQSSKKHDVVQNLLSQVTLPKTTEKHSLDNLKTLQQASTQTTQNSKVETKELKANIKIDSDLLNNNLVKNNQSALKNDTIKETVTVNANLNRSLKEALNLSSLPSKKQVSERVNNLVQSALKTNVGVKLNAAPHTTLKNLVNAMAKIETVNKTNTKEILPSDNSSKKASSKLIPDEIIKNVTNKDEAVKNKNSQIVANIPNVKNFKIDPKEPKITVKSNLNGEEKKTKKIDTLHNITTNVTKPIASNYSSNVVPSEISQNFKPIKAAAFDKVEAPAPLNHIAEIKISNVKTSGALQHMDVELKPEGLGKVVAKVKLHDNKLIIEVKAENKETARLLSLNEKMLKDSIVKENSHTTKDVQIIISSKDDIKAMSETKQENSSFSNNSHKSPQQFAQNFEGNNSHANHSDRRFSKKPSYLDNISNNGIFDSDGSINENNSKSSADNLLII